MKINSVIERKRIIEMVFRNYPKITNCPFCNKICGNKGLLVMHMKACKYLEKICRRRNDNPR